MNAEILSLAVAIGAARLAAEFAVRWRQPVVLAEIIAGIALGPHALGLIDPGEGLHFVAELGAILLLLEVGLHLDLNELRSVGGSALRVALIGMVTPMALAYPLALAFGEPANAALFIAAGLTATSVGVTARVFQEMRILDTPEARTVLGAAVVDDVLGLLILAVMVPLSTGAALDAMGVARTAGSAIGFVIVAAVLAVPLVPRLLNIASISRTDGATGVVALATGFGVAAAAGMAGLAPIVGAFVAGLAMSGSSQSDEVRRSMQSVVRVLVPVFFLTVGTEVDMSVAADTKVLIAVVVLTAVSVAAKTFAGIGASRRTGDRWIIGLGMVPRGEVGLIFAGIGLAEGILPESGHAILVLTVMATTIIAPPLLRMRAETPGAEDESVPEGQFLEIIRDGDMNSWRLLSQKTDLAAALGTTGAQIVERLANPLNDAHPARLLTDLRRVIAHPFDPSAGVWARTPGDHDIVRVAALAQDTLSGPGAPAAAAELAVAIGLSPSEASEVANLVRDRALLPAAAGRHDATEERTVLELAAHIGDLGLADRLYLLAAATLRESPADRARLDALFRLVRAALEHPELTGRAATTILAQRRSAAEEQLGSFSGELVRQHLDHAPRAYLLAHEPAVIARHIRLSTPRPIKNEVRLEAEPKTSNAWTVHVVAVDRPGLLAAVTGAIASAGGQILEANISTWPDDLAVDVFTVAAGNDLDWEGVRRAAEKGRNSETEPPQGVMLRLDNDASPWYTLVEVEGPDGTGMLHRTAATFSKAGVEIHGATIATRDGRAIDRFEVTARDGGKLSPSQSATLIRAFEGRDKAAKKG